MKRILFFLAMALWLVPSRVTSCYFEPDWLYSSKFLIIQPYHNNDCAYPKAMLDETVSFWHNYVGGKVSKDTIRTFFKETRDWDSELLQKNTFLKQLATDAFAIKYLKACFALQAASTEHWNYEMEEVERADVSATIATLTQVPAAFTYRVALLKMRAACMDKDYEQIEKVWNSQGKSCPDSQMKVRMEGYYAHALFLQERYKEAVEIYARLGDERSLNMCISKYVGYDSIKRLADEGGDNTLIYYVMQDYANYYENHAGRDLDYADEDYLAALQDANRDAERLKQLCREHQDAADGVMWTSLLAWLELSDGNYEQAQQAAELAMRQKPNQLQRENAQRIQMMARLKRASVICDDKELKQLASDFKTLLSYAKRECKVDVEHDEDNTFSLYYADEYMNQRPNCCFLLNMYKPALVEYLKSHSLLHAQLSVLLLCETLEKEAQATDWAYEDMIPYESYWSSEWFSVLNTETTVQQLGDLLEATKRHKGMDAFAKVFVKQCKYPESILNDLMGTKLMRVGDYEQALPYLSALTPKYICSTHYQPYLSIRSFKKAPEALFDRTQCKEPEYSEEPLTDSRNYKAEFCQTVIDCKKAILQLFGNQKAAAEMELAARFFQASSSGDLWPLSDYGWSSYVGERSKDVFCEQSREMLKKALSHCTDSSTKLLIYYGLASVPASDKPFYTFGYDWEAEGYAYNFESYHPATQAYEYLKLHRNESKVTSKCDVLKWYSLREL